MTTQYVDDLLASLKIIGMLDDAQPKLRLQNGRLALGHASAVWRWLAGDSRVATFAAVRATVASAIQTLDDLRARREPGSDDAWLAGRLLAELRAARGGIDRLSATYAGDSLAVAQLQVLAERIDQAVTAAETCPRIAKP